MPEGRCIKYNYTDDINSLIIKPTLQEAVKETEADLHDLQLWATIWRLSINMEKTVVMLFNTRTHTNINIKLGNKPIAQVLQKRVL